MDEPIRLRTPLERLEHAVEALRRDPPADTVELSRGYELAIALVEVLRDQGTALEGVLVESVRAYLRSANADVLDELGALATDAKRKGE